MQVLIKRLPQMIGGFKVSTYSHLLNISFGFFQLQTRQWKNSSARLVKEFAPSFKVVMIASS
jgi:hypothetical protein